MFSIMKHFFLPQGVHLLVTNRLDMGHLVSSESFVPTHFRPELWEMFENRWDWEARYLHVNFSHGLQENATIAMVGGGI